MLESWSVGRARRAIAALLDLAPPTVRLVRTDGTEVEVPVAEVAPGDRFVVPAGSRIALDGRVIVGASAVNQAPITGESLPVEKEPGSEVFAGTINGHGTLTVETTKAAEDTRLARIIRMVEEAHARRSPTEQWVDRFARVYTPAVMLLALFVFLLPPLLFGGGWGDWFYRALVLLVIACPCALVISTPVSIVASLAAAAREGVLVKGGAFIELPARLQAIAMDKTGTITRGEPEVVKVIPLNNHTEAELLARAAALEARSTHPLARAILHFAEKRGVAFVPATDVQVLKGRGLSGIFNGEPFWLGSQRYVVERGQDEREIAREAERLEVHAELLPEDKLHKIEELASCYGTVAMVGYGVNDAPALARASLGVAMGTIGSDAAIETADVALMTFKAALAGLPRQASARSHPCEHRFLTRRQRRVRRLDLRRDGEPLGCLCG